MGTFVNTLFAVFLLLKARSRTKKEELNNNVLHPHCAVGLRIIMKTLIKRGPLLHKEDKDTNI